MILPNVYNSQNIPQAINITLVEINMTKVTCMCEISTLSL